MEIIREFIDIYNAELIIGIVIAFIILLIFYLILAIRVLKMKKRYKELVRGKDRVSIEDILVRNGHEIDDLMSQNKELQNSIQSLNTKLTFAIQKVGFIRYSAFGDLGTDLSFSVALLDNFLNGFVLTSLYNRGQSIAYAKPIKSGKSVYPLSVEEIQAVDRAIKGESYIDSNN